MPAIRKNPHNTATKLNFLNFDPPYMKLFVRLRRDRRVCPRIGHSDAGALIQDA
jgi:hypothetical protein